MIFQRTAGCGYFKKKIRVIGLAHSRYSKNRIKEPDWFWVFKNPQRINGFHERTSGPFSVFVFFPRFFGF